MRLPPVLLVALGGALGAVARYGVGLAAARAAPAVPLGTWAVNLAGCFLVGLAGPRLLAPGAEAGRLLLVVGFLGAFTTFSAFSAETLALLRAGRVGMAALNVAGSVALGLLLTAAGWRLARAPGAP